MDLMRCIFATINIPFRARITNRARFIIIIMNNNNDGIYIAHFHMLNALYNTLRGS